MTEPTAMPTVTPDREAVEAAARRVVACHKAVLAADDAEAAARKAREDALDALGDAHGELAKVKPRGQAVAVDGFVVHHAVVTPIY